MDIQIVVPLPLLDFAASKLSGRRPDPDKTALNKMLLIKLLESSLSVSMELSQVQSICFYEMLKLVFLFVFIFIFEKKGS